MLLTSLCSVQHDVGACCHLFHSNFVSVHSFSDAHVHLLLFSSSPGEAEQRLLPHIYAPFIRWFSGTHLHPLSLFLRPQEKLNSDPYLTDRIERFDLHTHQRPAYGIYCKFLESFSGMARTFEAASDKEKLRMLNMWLPTTKSAQSCVSLQVRL